MPKRTKNSSRSAKSWEELKSPSETTSSLTSHALMIANMNGCEVWRQNNHATRGRKFIGMDGLSDVIGVCKRTGIFLAFEIKGPGDKLSKAQIKFLDLVNKSGGIGIEVRNSREFTKIFLELIREKRSLVPVIKTVTE